MSSPKPPTSKVSDAEINEYLKANPGMSDSGIRQAMDKYGVNTTQMAHATGMNYGDVQNRYNKAGGQGTTASTPASTPASKPVHKYVRESQIKNFLSSNPGMSDTDIRKYMDDNGILASQMARVTGMKFGDVRDRYNKAGDTAYDPRQQRVVKPAVEPRPNVGTTLDPVKNVLTNPVKDVGTNLVKDVRTPVDVRPVAAPMKKGGKVTAAAPMKKGGKVTASRRGDGIAQRGKTRGKMI
jgi:uncharacterized protein YneF (UPF0154 family)